MNLLAIQLAANSSVIDHSETHSTDKSIMFSRAVMEDLGISVQFSWPLILLGAEDKSSAIQETNRSNTEN